MACWLSVKGSGVQEERSNIAVPPEHPNIIIFLVDDMGWQDCSLPFWTSVTDLNKKYRTPNMERMAANGMKFTDAYANSVCTPSRVSLMTGMNVARHRVTNWTNVKRDTPTDARDSLLTAPAWNYNGMSPVAGIEHTVAASPLPTLLRDAGYYTVHCGKAHFGSSGTPASDPLKLGFEVNIGGSSAGHPGSYLGSNHYNYAGRGPADTMWAVRGLEKYAEKDIFLTEALTREAVAALERNRKGAQKPFFLYLAHYAIHLPFDMDNRFYQQYIDRGLSPTEAKYAALIEGMDKSLGDIMDYLESSGLATNTYIIFATDNGGLSLTPQRGGARHTQNLPLKMGKGSLYEGGIRVPMIASGPKIPSHTVSHQPVQIEDLFPTVLELAGVRNYRPIQPVDGVSMVPFLYNPRKRNDKRPLIWHYPNSWTGGDEHGLAWMSAIRRGEWKLIYFHKEGRLELYNLNDDIGETTELSASHPRMLRKMAQRLTRELKARDAQLPVWKRSGENVPWPAALAGSTAR